MVVLFVIQSVFLIYSDVDLRLFVVLRGSVSVYFNPFLTHGQFRRGSVSSLEKVLISAAIGNRQEEKPKSPESGTSKRTNVSRRSPQHEHLIEAPDEDEDGNINDLPPGESKVMEATTDTHIPKNDRYANKPSEGTRSVKVPAKTEEHRRKVATTHLGQLIVKYGTCIT